MSPQCAAVPEDGRDGLASGYALGTAQPVSAVINVSGLGCRALGFSRRTPPCVQSLQHGQQGLAVEHAPKPTQQEVAVIGVIPIGLWWT